MNKETISAYVVNFNGQDCVLDTIQSLLDQERVEISVEVIDDGSTDDSVAVILDRYPRMIVHAEPHNTKKVNRLRTLGINLASTAKVFISDNDTAYDPAALFEMSKTMASDERIAACRPRLMDKNAPSLLYAGNSWFHFVGATIAEPRGVSLKDYNYEPRPGIGGGNVLLDVEKARRVGGFDEDYLLAWADDGEFFQRLMLAGYRCMYVPRAIAFHEVVPFSASRHYRAMGQIHNRWMYILTHHSLRTILLLIPAFIIFEIIQFFFYITKGIAKEYFAGNLLVLRNLGTILDKRKTIQHLRKVSDRELVFSGIIFVSETTMEKNKLADLFIKYLSGFLAGYWHLIRRLIP